MTPPNATRRSLSIASGTDMGDAEPAPERWSSGRANVARIYDYLLGGKDNYDVDRQAAERLLALVPDAAVAAWDNREFLGRTVRFLAEEKGIRQFLDIGTGLPTRTNVHSIAHESAPDARVVYVDYDPVVISHARALLCKTRAVCAVEGDLRAPEDILAKPELRAQINCGQPVAVLLIAILHFIGDADDPWRIVNVLKDAVPRGSYLVISHVTADHVSPAIAREVRDLYGVTSAAATPRSHADIARFFDGLEIVPPGLVNVASWRPGWMPVNPGRTLFLGGAGRKA